MDHGKLYFNFLFLPDIFEILNFREFDEVKTLWRRKKSRVLTEQRSSFVFPLPSFSYIKRHTSNSLVDRSSPNFVCDAWKNSLRATQRWLANHPTLQVRFYKFLQKTRKNCIVTTFSLVWVRYFCAKCKREKSFKERKLEFLVCFFPSPLRKTNLSIKRLETRGRRCRDNFYVPSTSH